MDGIGDTIRHRVFRDVKSEKVSIKNAEHFASTQIKFLNGIMSLCMPLEEVLTEPEGVSKAPKIPGTLEVHTILMVHASWNFAILRPTNRLSMRSGIEKMPILRFVATRTFHFHSIQAWPLPNVVKNENEEEWRVAGMHCVWSLVSREMFSYVGTYFIFLRWNAFDLHMFNCLIIFSYYCF